MANKTLAELDRRLDIMKIDKQAKDNISYASLEKDRQKIQRLFALPPIQRA